MLTRKHTNAHAQNAISGLLPKSNADAKRKKNAEKKNNHGNGSTKENVAIAAGKSVVCFLKNANPAGVRNRCVVGCSRGEDYSLENVTISERLTLSELENNQHGFRWIWVHRRLQSIKHMFWTQTRFQYLYLLMLAQAAQERSYICFELPIDHLPPILWCKHDVILTIPPRM